MTGEPLTLFAIDGGGAPRPSRRGSRRTAAAAALAPMPYPPAPATPASRRSVSAAAADENSSGDAQLTRLLLTPTEAARALGIGRSKLYELLRAGVVESVLIGSSRRIPAEALNRYVQALQQQCVT